MSKETKHALALITYGVVLYLALLHLRSILGAAHTFMGYFRPVITGIVIAYVLNLLMSRVEDRWLAGLWGRSSRLRRWKRGISLCLTLALVGVALFALGGFIFPEVGRSIMALSVSFPDYAQATLDYVNGLFSNLSADNAVIQTIRQQWEQILQALTGAAAAILGGAGPWLMGLAGTIGSGIMNLFLGLTFAIYMLAAKDTLCRLGNNILDAFVPRRYAVRIRYVWEKTNCAFSSFISGQLIDAVILGTLCGVGMAALKLPYPVLIGVLIGTTGLIPILGAYIGTIPSAFLVFMISPGKALIFIIFILILQQVDNNFIYPKVVGSSIGVGGLWILAGLIVGGNMFGLGGMILGIPTVAVLYALLEESIGKRLRKKPRESGHPPDSKAPKT